MNHETLIRHAGLYAEERHLTIARRLGFGIHGIILEVENNLKAGNTAIKIHRYSEPFFREVSIYQRLSDAEITNILGFNVPQLIGVNEDVHILEITIVPRPFVLDFAGAYLDDPPTFSEEIWAEWEVEKQMQFGNRWPEVQAVLAEMESLGIFIMDVSPSNIAFKEGD